MKLLRSLVVIACTGLLIGCAASIPPPELVDARQAYQHARVGQAAELKPTELYWAQEALAAAESSFQNDPASTRTRDLAYVAERKARLAEVLAASAARKAVTSKAKSDYQAILASIQTHKLIVEARRKAAENIEQKVFPQSTEAGSATKRDGQALKQPVRQSGQHPAMESTPAITHQSLDSRRNSPGGTRTARILLVDDDTDQRDSVRSILKSTDYHLVVAADCEHAINLIGSGMFDLILLSSALPGDSSMRVLASLKQYELTTRVIVIGEALGLESAVKNATLAAPGHFPER
jgi:PleD family two-component response regulator